MKEHPRGPDGLSREDGPATAGWRRPRGNRAASAATGGPGAWGSAPTPHGGLVRLMQDATDFAGLADTITKLPLPVSPLAGGMDELSTGHCRHWTWLASLG